MGVKTANVVVIRDIFSDDTTIGKLYINDEYFCYTLEDTVRAYGVKVHGKTAIPKGTYYLKLSMSSRFKRIMPMVFTEENGYEVDKGGITFKGIRIHGGNTNLNTEGCILVAYKKLSDKKIQGTAEKDLVKELEKYDRMNLTIINDTL